MSKKYKAAIYIYSILLIVLFLFILVWSLGMKENAKMVTTHYIMITFIISSIGLLFYFPYTKYKYIIGLINLVLLLVGTIFLSVWLLGFDLNLTIIIFTILYIFSVVIFSHEIISSLATMLNKN